MHMKMDFAKYIECDGFLEANDPINLIDESKNSTQRKRAFNAAIRQSTTRCNVSNNNNNNDILQRMRIYTDNMY